jgi:phosphoribosyl-ATP pyrophosphohydrolase
MGAHDGDSDPDLDVDLIRLISLGGGEPRTSEYSGSMALMLAVLEDGIRSYLSPIERTRTEAESWIESRRQDLLFSFHVVCQTLGLEPNAVRRALRRMRAKNGRKRSSIGRSRPNVRRAARALWRGTG